MSNPPFVLSRVTRARARLTLLAVGGVVAAAALSGCSAPSTTVGEAYPQASRDAFLSSCVAGGSTQEFCECALEALEENISFARFSEIDAATANGTVSEEDNALLGEVIQGCI